MELKQSEASFFNKLKKKDRRQIDLLKTKISKALREGLIPPKLSMPIGLQLELTTSCNMFCKHCYNQSGGQSSVDLMTSEDWISLSQHIVRNGGVFQVILSGGEPLLLGEDLLKIMDIFYADGSNFLLLTNGFLLNELWIEKFLKYPVAWLQISIDSVNDDRHDKFRDKKGAWHKAISGAIMVSQAGIPLKIASSITPEEIPYVEKLVEMSIELGASAIIIGDIMPSGRSFQNKGLILSPCLKKTLYNKIEELQLKYRDIIIIENLYSMRTQLEQASLSNIDGVIIRPNGDVRLDCIAPFSIGNIKEKKFKDIWRETQHDVWRSQKVQSFIKSVDYIDGRSNILKNYCDNDIKLNHYCPK